MPTLAAICRWLLPAACSRRTSRILRMDTLAVGTGSLSQVVENANGTGLSCVDPPRRQSDRDRVESVTGFPWNQRPGSYGIADRDAVESVTGITWNTQQVQLSAV